MLDEDGKVSWPVASRNKIVVGLGLLVLVAFVARRIVVDGAATAIVEFNGTAMGTTYAVKLVATGMTTRDRAAMADTIDGRLDEIDRLMSTYDSTSELSRFNRLRDTTSFDASRLTLAVFGLARDISERTNGALDVTVGPLVDAWGFGPTNRRPRIPHDTTVARLRDAVGYHKLEIHRDRGTIAKRDPNTVADLSAVAKGYGVDRVAEALEDFGVCCFLVEVGGELRAKGRKPDGTWWRVGIEAPVPGERRIHRVVELSDEAVATSGDYRNFFERDGVRYAHIIDPRSGRPIRHAAASVTVLHGRAAVADAWATALTVLGPDEGLALAEREGIAALFVLQTDGGFESHASSAFRARSDPGR